MNADPVIEVEERLRRYEQEVGKKPDVIALESDLFHRFMSDLSKMAHIPFRTAWARFTYRGVEVCEATVLPSK